MKISVVIPCRNEAPYIAECLEAIYTCELPEKAEMRVFVVDGMSDDGTRDIVNSLLSNYPGLELVDNVQQLTPFAFNLGIYAGGKVDFVQIVGARHILSPNYLIRCIRKLQAEPDTWCIGGKILNEYINQTGGTISKAMGTTLGMGLGNFRTLEKSMYTDTVTSPMYPYHVFEEVGFFDERLVRNQDDEFNFRVTKAGKKIFFDHEISLKYYVRGAFDKLWRQFFQYGYWKVFVNRKHKNITTIRQLVPPLFVLYVFLAPWTAFLGIIPFLISMVPLALYVFLVVLFSVKEAKGFGEVFQLIRTYLILHFSYGFGYLRGILDFIIFRKEPSSKQQRLSR